MIFEEALDKFSAMTQRQSWRWSIRPPTLMPRGTSLLFVLMALYCVIGFTGFDPARQDEAYIFDIILEYYRGQSSWLVPQLAGYPFMEKPPLYYLLASLCARAFSPWLSLHDAARLCSGFLAAASTLCMAYAGRLTWGSGYGRFTALALLCSLGLFVPAHMMLTDNAQLTGFAMALVGLAGHTRNRWWSGLVLGTGAGFAFLSKGLFGPGVIALASLLLLVWSSWRSRAYVIVLVVACLAALPWLLIWPLELYRKSPALFGQWLMQNNFDRFAGTAPAYLNAVNEGRFWYTKFLWGTFPTLPLALASLWQGRATLNAQPALQIGLVFALTIIAVLADSATLRAIYALPILLAFALIAAPMLHTPPRWLLLSANLSRILFVMGALLIWAYWLLAILFKVHWLRSAGLSMTDVPSPRRHFNSYVPLMAGAITVLWFVCQRAWRQLQWRASADWYSSFFCLLALFSLLCLPVESARSSYRHLFREMARYLPRQGCINSIGLGESQQGMLDYVLNVQTKRVFKAHDAACNTLLIDTRADSPIPYFGDDWQLRWQGKRSARDHEVFYIFSRYRNLTGS